MATYYIFTHLSQSQSNTHTSLVQLENLDPASNFLPVLGRGMKRSFSSDMRSGVVPIPPILPVGFRFNPSDEELIDYYLVELLNNSYSNDMPIGMVDFLEFEPWELPDRSRIKSHDQVWYFFYQRDVYVCGKKRMYKRKTRAGHWSSTGEPMIIENLGKRITLRFYKDSPKQMTQWIAYEYEITKMPNPGEFVIIKLMISSGEKRTKMNTNTSKQNSQKTTTSTNDGSPSPDELMTMSNCYSREDVADFGNQNIANTAATSTYSIPQQCIQKDTVSEVINMISYSSYVVSSEYGHGNPEEMAIMSTYDIGESSSQATSCDQNHWSVSGLQECGYFHTGVSTYILENQEDGILSSDFENQKLSSEVKDCPTKATPCTENQFENQKLPTEIEDSQPEATPYEQANCLFASDFENEKLPSEVEDSPPKITPCTEKQLALDETNTSCSMTSRHVQNEEFNLSFLEDDDFFSLIDFDVHNETNETFPQVDV